MAMAVAMAMAMVRVASPLLQAGIMSSVCTGVIMWSAGEISTGCKRHALC
jgi:hypothetical protein